MTGWDAFKASYDLQVNTDVVGKDTADSVDTADVGNIGLELSAGLEPFIDAINAFTFYTGTLDPNDLDGIENDIYYQTNGGTSIVIWRKTTTTWEIQTTVPLGITYNDGIIIGLRTQIDISALAVTVTAGNWAINNVIYGKNTPTVINYDAPEIGSDRIDTIYADTLGQILYLAGAPSGTPVKPTLPANTIEVDSIYVPADATGNPYLFTTGTANDIPVNPVITATQATLAPDGGGGWTLPVTIPNGFTVPPNAIVLKSGVRSFVPIQVSPDGTALTGFTDNDTQTITIKLI